MTYCVSIGAPGRERLSVAFAGAEANLSPRPPRLCRCPIRYRPAALLPSRSRSAPCTFATTFASFFSGVVVVQVSLSLALICSAALLGRSRANVLSVDPGFDADPVVGFTVSPGS